MKDIKKIVETPFINEFAIKVANSIINKPVGGVDFKNVEQSVEIELAKMRQLNDRFFKDPEFKNAFVNVVEGMLQ